MSAGAPPIPIMKGFIPIPEKAPRLAKGFGCYWPKPAAPVEAVVVG